ncbi:MarR family winged helix-turn-helix transcriptional regulator [Modestobacter roseus]|uniref:MarR family winged helix-turn-helix transcriptional regulator n=1 Tax=Modestobacter roseus TaxID=1181884 RepID=UPI001E4F787D|nr:MarR family transcriptional regulator [Modestobacter roseus]
MSAPQPSVALDDQLCFALYAASRAVTARYRPMLDQLGLTYPQLLVLMVLWEADGLPVHSIAERLQLDTGTMSPLLKRLSAAGLVVRERSTADERQVIVRLTDVGSALRRPAEDVSAVMIGALQLDQQEFDRMKGQLERLSRNVATVD